MSNILFRGWINHPVTGVTNVLACDIRPGTALIYLTEATMEVPTQAVSRGWVGVKA